MNAAWTLVVYCLLILLASLAGGWIPLWIHLTHQRMQVAISFVAGAMLGIGVLHLLPHAIHEIDSVDRAVQWLIAGFLVMFFVERFFHFHHHDVAADGHAECEHHDHEHHLEQHAPPTGTQTGAAAGNPRMSWGGAAIGLALHSMIDGVAVAASVAAESSGDGARLAGLGTFLVIFLHKPFDAMTVGALLAAGGWSVRWRHLANALLALAIPVGVAAFYLGLGQSASGQDVFLGAALAFAAGSFLCISTSDLLPELQFHEHDRVKLSLALLAGLLAAWAIGLVEVSGHDHFHGPRPHQ